MSPLSPTFNGRFDHALLVTRGGRRILLVEIDDQNSARLDSVLGPAPYRSREIPVTFVIGRAAETAALIRDEIAAQAETEGRAGE